MTPGFWRLLEETRLGEAGPSAHADAITAALVDAGTEETLEFVASFDEAIDALFTWSLWGAGYLAMGGCSDDGFEYLRAWIIGAGETTWNLARTDPEKLFTDLLAGTRDPSARWEELGLHEAETLLYAGGAAYEQLTGEWLPPRSRPSPSEPSGETWDEDDLSGRFPRLAAAIPDGWSDVGLGDGDGSGTTSDHFQVMARVEEGVAAFLGGDHLEGSRQLDEIVDDDEQWGLVEGDRVVDVAYVVGISRLLAGDVEGASAALMRVEGELGEADHARRALAQVELARDDLESAGHWIDDSESAQRLDRVLAAKLAWRRGDQKEALRRAMVELDVPTEPDEHLWDVAGNMYQLGQIFAGAGEVERAQQAVDTVTGLLGDAPDDLPLRNHVLLLQASISRLLGRPGESLEILSAVMDDLAGTDLAECLREQARAQLELGLNQEARASYEASIAAFQRAGERWETRVTRGESGLGPWQGS